ncbi:MAG: dihydropteroate synthase [Deltaproteobacteria bacterium]|nr:dihydropteroate synthase [Deltaproteobacteria bacterium]
MKTPVRLLNINSLERAAAEMERVGVDPVGIDIMAPKQFHYNFKVAGLKPAQANVLKQDALSIGAEAAVARGAASCSIETSDAILSGTARQLDLLIEKLAIQSFDLPEVALALRRALTNTGRRSFVIAGRSRLMEVGGRTLIMGILNATPDSFSDGGRNFEKDKAIEHGLRMASDGADWVDVGGESTRPGAGPVPVEEELRRVVPVVAALAANGVTVSIDTMKAAVAKAALEAGAEIVNDVSALGMDAAMAGVCREYNAPVILMHMRADPRTMQYDVEYEDIMASVFAYLAERMAYAADRGIGANKIILDPGIGFGKDAGGNLALIRNLAEFKSLGRPLLVGASRKSFIGRITGEEVSGRLSGTIAAHTAAILNGANIVRAHDVAAARSAAMVADAIMREAANSPI